MSRIDDALATFAEGFNCAQSIAAIYGPPYGVPRETCLQLATPFGGGMGRTGQACGVVSGAVLVIGLATGTRDATDAHGKQRCYQITRAFIERFIAAHGAVTCPALLGFDLGTTEGLEQAKIHDIHHTVCPAFVRTAAELLDAVLADA